MRRNTRLMGAVLLIVFLFVSSAPGLMASEITPFVNDAESQFARGNVLGAASALRQALVEVYNRSSLKVAKAVLVKVKPAGFGMIQPRRNNKYRSNETIIIYVEPIGYHFAKGNNSYSFGVTADFAVTDVKGNILGGKKGFGSWEVTTRSRPLFDFYMTLTYNFTGIKPGKYFIITTLNDKHGGGSATIKTPIEVVH